ARRRGDKDAASMEFDFPAPVSVPAEASIQPPQRLPKIIRFPSLERTPDAFAGRPCEVPEDHSWRNLDVEPQETPRILEVEEEPPISAPPLQTRPAEQMELLPSFEDIQLGESEHWPAIQSENLAHAAPLRLRAIAAGVDGGLV